MGVTNNMIALLLATATGFTSAYSSINLVEQQETAYTNVQRNIEQASMISQGAGMTNGITVIDRAKNNTTKSNGVVAHQQFSLQTLAKLPILIYIARQDRTGYKENKDVISMMEGYSAESTTKLWEEYGGIKIIQDLSKVYNLQETTADTQWDQVKMSSLDVSRLLRRFMDDKTVPKDARLWTIDMMRSIPLSISGEDLSFGIPRASGIVNESGQQQSESGNDDKNMVVWMQGWSPSGASPMVRHSVGFVGKNMRFIVVSMGQTPDTTKDEDANRISTQSLTELIKGGDDKNSSGDVSLATSEDQQDPKVIDFDKKQLSFFK